MNRLHLAPCLRKNRPTKPCTRWCRSFQKRHRGKPSDRISVSSITPTRSLLANFTTWRFQNTKNISTTIRDVPAGRTLTSRLASAIEISIAFRVLAQICRKCSTITVTANLPRLPRMLSPRSHSRTRITRRRFRCFTVPPANQRSRRWRFPRVISKPVALKLSDARTKQQIFMLELPSPEIQIPIAKMRA